MEVNYEKIFMSENFLIYSLIIVCAFSATLFLSVVHTSDFAYAFNSSTKANSNTDSARFDSIQPKWYTEAYRLAYASNDNYSARTYSAVLPNYYSPSGGITATAIPLNDEMYSVDGTDNVGFTRIQPVTNLSDVNNITAQGYANIVFNNFRSIPSVYNCSMRNDTRKMKDLTSEFAISGDNTTVYYGKIMYRTAPYSGASWSGWNYIDLTHGASLNFYASKCVQIVVLYEIREEAHNIFKPVVYHHIVGIYRFDIV